MARKGRGKRSKFERRVPCEQKIIEKTLICITFLLKRRKSSRTSNKRNDGSSRRRKLSFRCGIIRNLAATMVPFGRLFPRPVRPPVPDTNTTTAGRKDSFRTSVERHLLF